MLVGLAVALPHRSQAQGQKHMAPSTAEANPTAEANQIS